MKMRALLAGLLVAVMCLSLIACGKTDDPVSTPESSDVSEEPSAPIVEPDVSGETSADVSGEMSGGDVSGEPDVSGETTLAGETTTTKAGETTKTTKKGETTKKTTAKPTKKGETTKAGDKKTTAKTTKKTTTAGKTKVTTAAGGKTTTAAKTTAKTTKTKKPPRSRDSIIYRNVTIQESKTKLEETYKDAFKGKSFKAITWTELKTTSYVYELEQFAEKYGCSIKQDDVNFESVRPLLATCLASGNAYDIIRVHGSWYPRVLIANLLQPLEKAFTTADLNTESDTTGIEYDQSKYFGWNNHLYGITTYDDCPIYYFYYNKKYLYGANDPWTLYNAGQWTWQKMKDIAANFKGTGGTPHFSDRSFVWKCFVMSNNTQLMKEVEQADGSVKLSASISGNTAFINALKMVQGMLGRGTGTGLYAPQNVLRDDGRQDTFENILNGNTVVWPTESLRFQTLYKRIKKEGVGFDRNVDNLGVAPFPLGPDNTAKRYPAGWLTGFSAGRGADPLSPKVVAALCKYHATYVPKADTTADQEAAAADVAVKKKMHKFYAKLNYCDFGYGTADGTLDNVLTNIENSIANGADITATLKKYDDMAEQYIRDALKNQ